MQMKEFGHPGGWGRASLVPPLDPKMFVSIKRKEREESLVLVVQCLHFLYRQLPVEEDQFI